MRTSPVVAIDLDAAEIEDEAVAERGVDLVVLGRRGQFRRRPEHGLADRLIDIVRQRARRPMAGGGDARERQRIVRIALRARSLPSANTMSVGCDVELRGGDARELVAQRASAASCAAPATAGAKRLE